MVKFADAATGADPATTRAARGAHSIIFEEGDHGPYKLQDHQILSGPLIQSVAWNPRNPRQFGYRVGCLGEVARGSRPLPRRKLIFLCANMLGAAPRHNNNHKHNHNNHNNHNKHNTTTQQHKNNNNNNNNNNNTTKNRTTTRTVT